ncbi:MAG TPA: hypothetical protein VES42_21455 [Pilimelia sp.]|nr:hypothetical protein [Pilimelia sp.]
MFFFVGIPALIVLLVGGLAYAFGGRRGSARRYRPGRPFEATPVWFLSAPERVTGADQRRAVAGAAQAPAISTGEVETGRAAVPQGTTGGASDRW